MIDYKKYKKAKIIELEKYKSPENGRFFYISSFDNTEIRVGVWENIQFQGKTKGTILLQQGHNEFIEKYFEVIEKFLSKKFNVICFDWRGQGLSQKMIDDPHKQYIEDFSFHNQDLNYILNNLIYNNFNGPFIGIGHSMGGCIILNALKENNQLFEKVILSAPMLGFRNEKFLMPFISLTSLLQNKEKYMIGSKPNMGKATPFKENDLTHDESRYLRTQRLVSMKPEIRLWGITNAWSKAVKKRLLYIREKDWAENIETDILFINSLDDEVVSSNHIIETSKRFKNSKMVNFESCKHEIFMEKDRYRKIMWNEIDVFLKKEI